MSLYIFACACQRVRRKHGYISLFDIWSRNRAVCFCNKKYFKIETVCWYGYSARSSGDKSVTCRNKQYDWWSEPSRIKHNGHYRFNCRSKHKPVPEYVYIYLRSTCTDRVWYCWLVDQKEEFINYKIFVLVKFCSISRYPQVIYCLYRLSMYPLSSNSFTRLLS